MIEYQEFTGTFSRLCKRWAQKEDPGRKEIYFDCLCNFDPVRLSEACERLMKSSRMFPTPDEIEQTYLALRKHDEQKEECQHCEYGHVMFTLKEMTFGNLCAHCNERSVAPLVAKVGDAIFWAYKETAQTYEGNMVYRSDLQNMVRIKGAFPTPILYKKQPKEITDRLNKYQTKGKTPGNYFDLYVNSNSTETNSGTGTG